MAAETRKWDPETRAVVTLPAGEAFEQGPGGARVRHDFSRNGVALYDIALVEDDSPGASATRPSVHESERSLVLTVGCHFWLKKILVVDDPSCCDATLYVRQPGGATVLWNGLTLNAPDERDETGSGCFLRVPAESVRAGENEVIIRADREDAAAVKLARRVHILENNPERAAQAPRSFASRDGGRSWQPLDGELTVRLRLTRHPTNGEFVSPVLDLAKTVADPLGLRPVEAVELILSCEADTPPGTGISLLLRTGSTATWNPRTWTEFLRADDPALAGRRYAQWKAVLSTCDARVSPVLKQVTLEAALRRAPALPWTAGVNVTTCRNGRAVSTSLPFEHEDPAHPRLRALRQKYRLDEVVREGRTEFEQMVLLRDWVARQWNWTPPDGHYPAWDADEILSRPDGMCVQFAIVYVQCCLAMGWPARFVFGKHPGTMSAGHEVVEVWSNDFAKWVFMDPTSSRNEFCADPETGVPLSLLEVRDRMVSHYYPGEGPITRAACPNHPRWCDRLALVRKRAVRPGPRLGGHDPAPAEWPSWTKWLYLWFIPRSDWFARPRPLPHCQGWNDWDWTDAWLWHDRRTPRLLNYGRYTNRRGDIEWTINEVVFGARAGASPRTIELDLGTTTPFFDTFLVRTNDGPWTPADAQYVWRLREGVNRIEMRIRNTAGVVGPVSFLEVELGTSPS